MSSTKELNFVIDPSEDLLCPICAKVLVDPHVTDCCGQHFCGQCLTKWFQGGKICPHCRSTNFSHIRYLPLKRKINDLQVYCSNWKYGCTTITSVNGLDDHLSECPYTTVKCSYKCGQALFRKDLTDHTKNKCQYRPSTCRYCQKQDKHYIIMGIQHLNRCPDLPVGCPNNCPNGGTVKRKDLPSHRLVCSLEPVNCPDCLIIVLRQELHIHLQRTCPKRLTICEYCKKSGPYDDITGIHMGECEEYPIGCPRQCKGSEQIKRKKLKIHAEVCPLEPVQCPFNEIGCNSQVLRKDLNNHLKSNVDIHMLRLMSAHTSLVAEHKKLHNDHSKLHGDHSKLQNVCSGLKLELADVQMKHSHLEEKIDTMISSTSRELEYYDNTYDSDDNLPVQCIKTVLNPKVEKEGDKIVFRVLQFTDEWISSPFYVLDGYKMRLVLTKSSEVDQKRDIQSGFNFDLESDPTFTKVSVQLMKGENDGRLKWPIDSKLSLVIIGRVSSIVQIEKMVVQQSQVLAD